MGWPIGMKRKRESIIQAKGTRERNILEKNRKQYFGEQIIGKFKSIIHWDSLIHREFYGRVRRTVRVTCGKCSTDRWSAFDNVRKQIRKPRYTGLCQGCIETLTWPERGRERPERRRTTEHGYVKVYAPEHSMAHQNGELYEHRLVMSKILGRPLTILEHVHHKNGNKEDNRPENLELVPSNDHVLITMMEQRIKSLESLLSDHHIQIPPLSHKNPQCS